MSRYSLASINPNHEVTIGYDRAGGSSGATFFAQVLDIEVQYKLESGDYADEELDELEEGANILVVGDNYSQPITNIDEIEQAIAPYAVIPLDIKQQLLHDQLKDIQLPPSTFRDYVQSRIDFDFK